MLNTGGEHSSLLGRIPVMMALLAYYGLLIAGLAAMLAPNLGWLALATYYVWMPLGALGVWALNGEHLRDLGVRLDRRSARHLGTVRCPVAVVGPSALVWRGRARDRGGHHGAATA